MFNEQKSPEFLFVFANETQSKLPQTETSDLQGLGRPEWSERQVERELIRLAFLPNPMPDWLEERFKNS
jgi:hypothetical protein